MPYPFPGVSATHLAFTRVFLAWSVLTLIIGVAVIWMPIRPDVRSAVAWQFIIWGGINLMFALNGLRTHRRFDPAASENLIAFFENNGWMNVGWTLLGVITLAAGLLMANAGIITHGVCVIVQALFLVMFDQRFKAALIATRPPMGDTQNHG
jgi:hypothetical protein